MNIKYIIGIVVLLAVLTGGGWYFLGNKDAQTQSAGTSAFGPIGGATQTISQQSSTGPDTPPSDCAQTSGDSCAEFSSSAYHFSLFHPQKQSVQTYDEGAGAQTITFQDVTDGSGFQIYVLPYTDTQVSEQRFKLDEPSGVRDSVREATVGGASGAAFYSKNAALGDTYEIWFIHGGYLYEVTTLKPLEQMLNSILATWRFTQ
jgi:hypothetical protein